MTILTVFVFSAAFAPWIAPHDPTEASLRDRNTPPVWMEGGNATFLLGTDTLGRDVLSRIIHGARVSVIIAALALTTSMVIGVTNPYL